MSKLFFECNQALVLPIPLKSAFTIFGPLKPFLIQQINLEWRQFTILVIALHLVHPLAFFWMILRNIAVPVLLLKQNKFLYVDKPVLKTYSRLQGEESIIHQNVFILFVALR